MLLQDTITTSDFQLVLCILIVFFLNAFQLYNFISVRGIYIPFSLLQIILLLCLTVYFMTMQTDKAINITSVSGISLYLLLKGLQNAFHIKVVNYHWEMKILKFLETIIASHCFAVIVSTMCNIDNKYQKIFLQILIPILFFGLFFLISKTKILIHRKTKIPFSGLSRFFLL